MSEKNDPSLIDLLAVFLKGRYLILIGTVLCSALAFFYLFVFSKPDKPLAEENTVSNVCAVYTIQAHRSEEDAKSERWYDFDFSKILQDSFSSKPEIASLYKEFPFLGLPENCTTEREFNNFVNTIVSQNKLALDTNKSWSREYRNIFHLSVIIPQENLDLLNSFVQEYIKQISYSLSKSVQPQTEFEFFTVSESPFVYDVAQNSNQSSNAKVKKFILLVIVAFAFFVLLTFLIDAISSVKKDDDARKTLHEALRTPLIKRK